LDRDRRRLELHRHRRLLNGLIGQFRPWQGYEQRQQDGDMDGKREGAAAAQIWGHRGG